MSCSSYEASKEAPLLMEVSRDDPSSSLNTSKPANAVKFNVCRKHSVYYKNMKSFW